MEVNVKGGKRSFRPVRIFMDKFRIGVAWLILVLAFSSSSSPLTALISSFPGSQAVLAVSTSLALSAYAGYPMNVRRNLGPVIE